MSAYYGNGHINLSRASLYQGKQENQLNQMKGEIPERKGSGTYYQTGTHEYNIIIIMQDGKKSIRLTRHGSGFPMIPTRKTGKSSLKPDI